MITQEAKVVKLTGAGDSRLRDAICQGLVTGELRKDVERALYESESTKRELNALKNRNAQLEAVRRENVRDRMGIYREWLRGKRRANAMRVYAVIGFISGVGFSSLLIALAMAVAVG